jgi:hypothetical protein
MVRRYAVLVALAGLLAAASPAVGEESKKDDFDTSWFGGRIGYWYEPALDMQLKVGGSSSIPGLPPGVPSRIEVANDLGIRSHQAHPVEYFESFEYGVPEVEVFFDTRWLSLSVWGVSPFRYEGRKVSQSTFTFGGTSFTVAREVETRLDQVMAGVEIKLNLLNNQIIRLSPVAAVRGLGIDWEVKDTATGLKAGTERIRMPLELGRWRVLPYPELGAEVRAGYRSIFEGDLRVTGMHLFYSGLSGTTALIEFGVTVYPLAFIDIENLGVRLGYRYFLIDLKSQGSPTTLIRDQWDARMEIQGMTISLLARF